MTQEERTYKHKIPANVFVEAVTVTDEEFRYIYRTKRLESENQKIKCGYRHFDEFEEVAFREATKLSDIETNI